MSKIDDDLRDLEEGREAGEITDEEYQRLKKPLDLAVRKRDSAEQQAKTQARDHLEKSATRFGLGAAFLIVLGGIAWFALAPAGTLAVALGVCCALVAAGYRLVADKMAAEDERGW